MPVMDEFREEREAIKNGSFKKKLGYFLDYYKWHVIGVIAGILILSSIIKDIVTAKDFIFYGLFLNSYGEDTVVQEYMDEFAELTGLDTENYDIFLDTSLSMTLTSYDEASRATMSRIMVNVSAGDLDFLAADPEVFHHYATSETFYDLREILTPEQIEKYESYFYYVDRAEIIRKAEELDAYVPKEFDHNSPEGMEEPLPVGLYLQDCKELTDMIHFNEDIAILGIPSSTKHLESSLQFIDYLFAE